MIEVSYSLIQGETVIATGSEEIRGGEGKSNAENGADLWFDASAVTDPARLVLKVEVSIADR